MLDQRTGSENHLCDFVKPEVGDRSLITTGDRDRQAKPLAERLGDTDREVLIVAVRRRAGLLVENENDLRERLPTGTHPNDRNRRLAADSVDVIGEESAQRAFLK